MDPAPPPAAPLGEVGGYRVVRVLSVGARATTAIVHDAGETLVARIFHSGCSTESIDAEVSARDAATDPAPPALREHVAALRDLCTLPDGRLAVLVEAVTGPSLETLLAQRAGGLALGETVTLLAPLAEALDAAHEIGLTGLGLDPAGVRLRTSGAPVVTRLRDARLGPVLPQRFRAAEAAYSADRAAFERLGAAVAAAVPERERPALLAVLGRADVDGSRLASALFDLAEPVPVQLGAPAAARPLDAGERQPAAAAPPSVSPVTPSVPAGENPVVATVLATLRQLALPDGLLAPVERIAEHAGRGLDRGRALVARAARAALPEAASRSEANPGAAPPRRIVRPGFAVAGLAGLAALLIAVTLGMGDGAADDSGAGRSTAASPASPAVAISAVGPPELDLHPEPEAWDSIVATLVDRWLSCHDASRAGDDAACAATAVHAASAAQGLLAAPEDSRHERLRAWRRSGGHAVVVERMGAAVLIDLVAAETTTASLLLVRSEAGWRIRDVIG